MSALENWRDNVGHRKELVEADPDSISVESYGLIELWDALKQAEEERDTILCNWCLEEPVPEDYDTHWRICEKHPAYKALEQAEAERDALAEYVKGQLHMMSDEEKDEWLEAMLRKD